MQVIDTKISDVKIIQPKIFGDSRGFFLETFEKKRYQEMLNIDYDFVQDNHSRSTKGVLRGLHFQTKHAQGKLVRVVRGVVFDVAVDIRPESPTYGQWEGLILSEENKTQFWIPQDWHMVLLSYQKLLILNTNVPIIIHLDMKVVWHGMIVMLI